MPLKPTFSALVRWRGPDPAVEIETRHPGFHTPEDAALFANGIAPCSPLALRLSPDATLFHELVHSTGHASRLDRDIETPAPFGSPDYSREELVAELGAAFLCSEAGIAPPVIENQAAYLAGWLKVLKTDRRAIVTAAGQAEKAADLILGRVPVEGSN